MCPVSIMQLLLRVKIRVSIFKRITCLFWRVAGCQGPLKTWLTMPLTLPRSKWIQCPRGGVPSYSTKFATLCPLNITLTLTVLHSFFCLCATIASLCPINLCLLWKFWIKALSGNGGLGSSYKFWGTSGLSLLSVDMHLYLVCPVLQHISAKNLCQLLQYTIYIRKRASVTEDGPTVIKFSVLFLPCLPWSFYKSSSRNFAKHSLYS